VVSQLGALARRIELDYAGYPLQLDGTDGGEDDFCPARRIDNFLRDEYLACARVVCDPCGHVHSSSEVVTLLEEDRPRVESHMRRRQTGGAHAIDHLQGGHHAWPRIAEVEHDAVAQPLDRLASVLC
jgi:hypothetical protein